MNRVRRGRFRALLLSAVLSGCHPSHPSSPTVEFNDVPLAQTGDPNRLTQISGRVLGAQPGQRVLLYARSQNTWYVQPYANQPFTNIQQDSSWRSSTHPGQEYAALLVGPQFHVVATTYVLPTEGVIAAEIIKGKPPLWRRWWALTIYAAAVLLAVVAFHRRRMSQLTEKLNVRFEERLAERTRVAQLLHDTLLQGVISASMQLNVAVTQLPASSRAIREQLDRVLESMGHVVEEGRNTLRALQTPIANLRDLERSLLQIPGELGIPGEVSVRVSGPAVPLQAHLGAELYGIGREALIHAFRDCRAKKARVELRYTASGLRLIVRHNGSPAPGSTLEGLNRRAEKIGARLRSRTHFWRGPAIEVRIASHAASESNSPSYASGLEVE